MTLAEVIYAAVFQFGLNPVQRIVPWHDLSDRSKSEWGQVATAAADFMVAPESEEAPNEKAP